MSRWDALKPTATQPSRRRQRPPNSSDSHQQQWKNDNQQRRPENETITTARRQPVLRSKLAVVENHEGEKTLETRLQVLLRSSKSSATIGVDGLDKLANMFAAATTEIISPRTAGETLAFLAEALDTAGVDFSEHELTNRSEKEEKALNLICHILASTKVQWSKLQANKVVSVLTHTLQSVDKTGEEKAFRNLCIQCLARAVSQCTHYLPAEDSCTKIVQRQFLPLLEQISDDEVPSALIIDIIVAIKAMLLDSRLKSALLAPLVGTVTSTGEEISIENPLRVRLFRALERLLTYANTSREFMSRIAIVASECIMVSLRAVSELEATIAKVDSNNVVFRPAALDQLLAFAFRKEASIELRKSALNLLHLTLECYPDSYAVIGGKYLFGNVVSSAFGVPSDKHLCSFCQYHHISPLLDILHSSTADHDEMRLATSCCSRLIQVMPLKLRINASNELHEYSIASPLGSKIGPSLEYLARVYHCQVRRAPVFWIKLTCQIMIAILQSVPFHNSRQGEAVAAADLLSYLAETMMDNGTTPENCMFVADAIAASIGGKLTPQGTRTTTTIPAEIWLSRESFKGFLHNLLTSANPRAQKYVTEGEQCLKIIKALGRMQPNLIMAVDRDWELFTSIIQAHVKATSSFSMRQEGLEQFVSLLSGRMDFTSTIILTRVNEVVSLERSVLRTSLHDPSSQCRCAGFQAYGVLLGIDWAEILNHSEDGFRALMAVLDHCSSNKAVGESNASARATACKAAGDICLTCLEQEGTPNKSPTTHSLSTDQLTELSTLVCRRMLDAIRDNNAGVKSMALFALGNMAYGLRLYSALIIPASDLSQVYEVVIEAIDDKNGKVCGNAIRTVGHIGKLALLHLPCLDATQLDRISSLHLRTLQALTRKVAAVVEDPDGLDASFSWKQRTEAKKHGWGTCNTLALLLSFETFPDNDDAASLYQAVFEVLVRCLERMQDTHEKISIAAIGALKAVPSSDLPRISGRSGLVGSAICCCLMQVKDLRRLNPAGRLHKELEQLLRHLLLSITSFDAVSVVKNVEVTKADIEFLYSWMTEHQVHAFSFQCFAVALQKSGWRGDASLEHKFANPPCTTKTNTDDFEDEL